MSNTSTAQEQRDNVTATLGRFALLSPELRLLVWEQVCTTPRCIDIWPVSAKNDEGYDKFEESTAADHFSPPFKYRSHNPVPSVLHVNGEARHVGLKYYTLSFGCYENIKIYANLECDIICPVISTPRTDLCEIFQEYFSICDETPIQRIALPTTEMWSNGSWHNWDMMRTFRPREIILYSGTPAGSQGEAFNPANTAPFVMELVSLAKAGKMHKISGSECERLKEAADTVEKEISTFGTFSILGFRRPVINMMYLNSSTQRT